MRLVFLADEIPSELRRIVEFLNQQMDPAEVLAVEVRQFIGREDAKGGSAPCGALPACRSVLGDTRTVPADAQIRRKDPPRWRAGGPTTSAVRGLTPARKVGSVQTATWASALRMRARTSARSPAAWVSVVA